MMAIIEGVANTNEFHHQTPPINNRFPFQSQIFLFIVQLVLLSLFFILKRKKNAYVCVTIWQNF